MHGAQPLAWDAGVARTAQDYADHLHAVLQRDAVERAAGVGVGVGAAPAAPDSGKKRWVPPVPIAKPRGSMLYAAEAKDAAEYYATVASSRRSREPPAATASRERRRAQEDRRR